MRDEIVDVWRKFYIRTWTDKKVMALSRPTPNGQTLLTWLIAGRQTGIVPGLFEIGERAFAELMGWPLHAGESLLEDLPKGLPKGFREAFAEVATQGFAKADWKARLVYVPGALKLDPPWNPNMVLSWRKAWRELPECALKDEAEQAFKSFFERYSKGFQEAFADVTGKGLANQDSGFRIQETGGKAPRRRSKTLKEVGAESIPNAAARALGEHWQRERQRAREIAATLILAPAVVESARAVIAQAEGDIGVAMRVVTAFVETDHKHWRENDWRLYLLTQDRDFAMALDKVGKTGRPIAADYETEAQARREHAEREERDAQKAHDDELAKRGAA